MDVPSPAPWHKEALKNHVRIHLGGLGHAEIRSPPSHGASRSLLTATRDAKTSPICRGPLSSFVPPGFSLSPLRQQRSKRAAGCTALRKPSSAAASAVLTPPTPHRGSDRGFENIAGALPLASGTWQSPSLGRTRKALERWLETGAVSAAGHLQLQRTPGRDHGCECLEMFMSGPGERKGGEREVTK